MNIDDKLANAARLEATASYKGMAGELGSLGLDGAEIAEQRITQATQQNLDKYRRMMSGGVPLSDILDGSYRNSR